MVIVSKFGMHMEYTWGYGNAKVHICTHVYMSRVVSLVEWYTQKSCRFKLIFREINIGTFGIGSILDRYVRLVIKDLDVLLVYL